MKRIMAAAFALCMLGGVAFAQTATSKAPQKKEAKVATNHEHHATKTKNAKHVKHAKAEKNNTDPSTNGQ